MKVVLNGTIAQTTYVQDTATSHVSVSPMLEGKCLAVAM